MGGARRCSGTGCTVRATHPWHGAAPPQGQLTPLASLPAPRAKPCPFCPATVAALVRVWVPRGANVAPHAKKPTLGLPSGLRAQNQHKKR